MQDLLLQTDSDVRGAPSGKSHRLDLNRHRADVGLVLLELNRIHVARCAIGNKEIAHRPETDAAQREFLSAFEDQLFPGSMPVRVSAFVNSGLRDTLAGQERPRI